MEKRDYIKKDLPLICATASIQGLAYMLTILEMQSAIMSKITGRPLKDITKQMNKDIKNNEKMFSKMAKDSFDDVKIGHRWN